MNLDKNQQKAVESNAKDIMVIASAGSGKALVNGSKVQTPNGSVNIENLLVGDKVFGTNGEAHNVIGVFPQGEKQVYEVNFSDGTTIRCNDEHLWTYQTRGTRQCKNIKARGEYKTKTLREIMDEVPLKMGDGWNIYIPMAKPVRYPGKDLSIPPYLLGALLGDGSLGAKGSNSFSNSEADVIRKVDEELNSIGWGLNKCKGDNYDYSLKATSYEGKGYQGKMFLSESLELLGLKGKHSYDKFIPSMYKESSVEDRLAVLKGLIDTDGECTGSGYAYSTASKQLSDDIKEIVESLGGTATEGVKQEPKYTYKGVKMTGRPSYRLQIKTGEAIRKIHTSKKHESKWEEGQSSARRTIRSIVETDTHAQMTCISVDAPDKLFLTDNYVVTHNTLTLVERVRHLVEVKNVEPSSIACITFTNMASNEMKKRLGDVVGIGDAFIGTIHSFANTIFKQSSINYMLLTTEKSIELHTEVLERNIFLYKNLTLQDYLAFLDIEKLYLQGLASEEEAIPGNFFSPSKYAEYMKLENSVYALCKERNIITFNELLEKTKEYYESIDGSMEYVLVDEFQDVGLLEAQFISSLNATNTFLVGDDYQSIYGFKGADVDIFKNVVRDKNVEVITLENSYRCAKEILDFGDKIIKQVKSRIKKNIIPMSTAKGRVRVDTKANVDMYLSEIAQQGDFRDWFILCRSNKEVFEMLGKLRNMGVPCMTFKREGHTEAEMMEALESNIVKILTVHVSKGLESKNVILYGRFPETLPGWMMKTAKVKQVEEERRVMYVGITRAKENLIVLN